MAVNASRTQDNFIVRTTKLSAARVQYLFRIASGWRRRAVSYVDLRLRNVHAYLMRHWRTIFFSVVAVVFSVFAAWYLHDWREGMVSGNAVQTGVGGLIGGTLLGAALAALTAAAAFGAVVGLNFLMRLLAPVVLFVPLILGVPAYALLQCANLLLQLLLLVPLVIMFVVTRAAHWAQKKRNTCPSRSCPSQVLPNYVCQACGTANPNLWPSLVGLLHHPCINPHCTAWLPTLDVLHRDELERRCAVCNMPLEGRHTLKGPEILVSLAGSSDAGKTCYLLMAVDELLNRPRPTFGGEIDIPADVPAFRALSASLQQGQPPDKTATVLRAFLLWTKVGKRHCQLYLYDNPGEEFRQLTAMTEQQYYTLVEGVVLLVDPFCFAKAVEEAGSTRQADESFGQVLQTMVERSLGGVRTADGRIHKRIAVVLSKADEAFVRRRLEADIRQGPIPSDRVRQLLLEWGGHNDINKLENGFTEVEYFACSPLGRPVNRRDHTAFCGHGVLEPLYWVVTGQHLNGQGGAPARRGGKP